MRSIGRCFLEGVDHEMVSGSVLTGVKDVATGRALTLTFKEYSKLGKEGALPIESANERIGSSGQQQDRAGHSLLQQQQDKKQQVGAAPTAAPNQRACEK